MKRESLGQGWRHLFDSANPTRQTMKTDWLYPTPSSVQVERLADHRMVEEVGSEMVRLLGARDRWLSCSRRALRTNPASSHLWKGLAHNFLRWTAHNREQVPGTAQRSRNSSEEPKLGLAEWPQDQAVL
jgi:hypothetical protein